MLSLLHPQRPRPPLGARVRVRGFQEVEEAGKVDFSHLGLAQEDLLRRIAVFWGTFWENFANKASPELSVSGSKRQEHFRAGWALEDT